MQSGVTCGAADLSSVCMCDNAAVVSIVKSGTSKDSLVMHLMRCMFLFTARHQLVLLPKHLPGIENVAADHLSHNALSQFLQLMPEARTEPTVLPEKLMHGGPGVTADRLDISELERRAAFFANGLAASSLKIYKAGENRHVGFCQRYSIVPLPVSESGLCKFVTCLAEQGLKCRTIKTYLAGIRYLHIRSGLQEPFHGVHMPRFEYTTRGIKRFQALSMTGGRTRLLITPPIMRQIKEVWLEPNSGSRLNTYTQCQQVHY